ncbi:MAG: MFS transporter, partial [Humibacillus sp.]
MSPTFHSLGIRNYRVYASGAIVSNIGTWMGRVAQDWLVLTVLTDHSSIALGIVTGLQFLPFLILAPFAGALVDRLPKRRILFATQTALLVTALLLAVLTATGVVQLWHVYVLALLQGVATAVDNPARQTFVSEMVDVDHLSNAVALNSASFNLGRLVGPGVAGLVIAWFGIAPALYINSATFLFVLVALLRLHTSELTPSPRARGKGQIREGLRYVKGRPDLILIMFL